MYNTYTKNFFKKIKKYILFNLILEKYIHKQKYINLILKKYIHKQKYKIKVKK
jgi:hypothetical protein